MAQGDPHRARSEEVRLMAANGERATAALALGVWATFALDVYSTFCSSPQTTELNAPARAPTLMKYVMIGFLLPSVQMCC